MMVQNILSNLPNKYFKGLTVQFSCRVPNILEMQKKATKEGSKTGFSIASARDQSTLCQQVHRNQFD